MCRCTTSPGLYVGPGSALESHLAWPWVSLEKALVRTRFLTQLVSLNEGFIHGGAHLGAVVLLLIGLLWSLVRLRSSYTVFLLLVTLQVTALNFLLSTPRLMLSGFPLFSCWAMWPRTKYSACSGSSSPCRCSGCCCSGLWAGSGPFSGARWQPTGPPARVGIWQH